MYSHSTGNAELGFLIIAWFFGLWVAQLAWVGMGAKSRGRDPGAWVLAALAWGPFAMLSLIVAGPVATPAAASQDKNAERAAQWLKSA